MGQHTWFAKSKEQYLKLDELYEKQDAFDEGKIYLDNTELLQLNQEIDKIEESNEAEGYHDLFRTNKRNEDKSYINETLSSRKECFDWINDPNNKVTFKHSVFDTPELEEKYKQHAIKRLNEFWDKYPNGLIYFG